jgi:electron transfer flavoprotein beta subunit
MKILVCISRTPDTTAKIAFTENNTKFATEGVQWIINPYDEWYALVRAIELKEKDPSISLHLITVGDSECDPIIRKALALGGDEAIRVNTANTDAYYIASQIAHVAKEGSYDMIMTGKETIDHNGSSIGPMISELMELHFIGLATKLEISSTVGGLVTREIEAGEETMEVAFPFVISCQKGMAEARIPNMRGIMAARTKPLNVLEPISVDAFTNNILFELPPAKSGVRLIPAETPELLVKILKEEAKVI